MALFFMLGSIGCYEGVGVGISIDVENITPQLIDDSLYVYSAKIVCGTISDSLANSNLQFSGQPLVSGTYLTAINIHNPHEYSVPFSKQVVVTNPQGQRRGRVGEPFQERLGPNEGVEVDCSNIYDLLRPDRPPKFLKGFVVIKTDRNIKLDVTAVYTLKNIISK
ncbi:hypothetical protein ACFL5P_02385 [candidate division KSB1 bacterium]